MKKPRNIRDSFILLAEGKFRNRNSDIRNDLPFTSYLSAFTLIHLPKLPISINGDILTQHCVGCVGGYAKIFTVDGAA